MGASPPRARLIKRAVAVLTAVALAVGLAGLGAVPAVAADPTASMSIQKAASAQTVQPGQDFTYTIQVQCTAGTVNGCVNAAIDDPMPPYLTINGTPTVTGTSNFQITSPPPDDHLAIGFTDNLGGGQTGLAPGNVVTITVPVHVADDAPTSADGQVLTNTATITADNANTKDDSADVTLHVPSTLAAGTTKSINPSGGPNTAGSTTTATVNGTNNSNVPVHQIVINDPVPQDDGTPPTTGNPFQYLELSTLNGVTYPDGADTAQLRVYVPGTGWVDGPVVNAPDNPTLPAGVDPADVTGVQLIFTDTTGDGIPPGASGGFSVQLALRDVIPEDQLPLVITNDADTTVTDADGNSATSDPASATYRIPPNEVDVSAGKTFDPKTVHAGDPSTVTLTGTNESSDPLDSMTITEPAPGTPNNFANGEFTFTGGSGNVVFPDGATAGTVTYNCNGTPGTPQDLTNNQPLPDPPAGCDVTGFSVTFTGPINPGGTATIPFEIKTNPDQPTGVIDPDERRWLNVVRVEGSRDGNTGDDTAAAVLKTIKDRIKVDVDKTIVPSTIPSFPGQIVTAELSGRLLPFPDSTVDATTIVVQDPAQFPDPNNWFDHFDPRSVTATPVPACSTLSVQYTTDEGGTWTSIPGMEAIHGATIFNGAIPDDVSTAANGIRFVYTADPAGGSCSGGFPPGTSVSPNLAFSLDEDNYNDQLDPLTNCAESSGTSATAPDAHSDPACDDVHFNPVNPGPGPGGINPIDKAWDQDTVIERSESQVGATLSWSTNGFTGIGRVDITDTQTPDTTAIPDSVFDSWDLVRIDPITPTDDPLLTYDEITEVQLYEPSLGGWVDASADPCPTACDGMFPGYTLTAAERANTIGFRLTYVESPTRADRLSAGAPPVGSGVAASTGNNRHVHPVFELRDVRRSDPTTPVTADQHYNATDDGFVDNTVRVAPYRHVDDPEPILTREADDTIEIIDVPLTADATKTWDGGPLAIPQSSVPQNEYPTSRITVTGSNTTPAKIGTLSITDPDTTDHEGTSCTTNPFDTFNLVGFTTITPPSDIGATDVTITLTDVGGGTTNYTRDEALALTESQLTDVVGMTVTYTGRINAGSEASPTTATVTFDARLRTANRSTGAAPQPSTVCNQTHVHASDMDEFPGYAKDQDVYRQADIDLVPSGIGVIAGKSFDPDTITEPSHGPVTVTLSGQPVGPDGTGNPPSRAVKLVLTDSASSDAARFWNAYNLASLNNVTFTNPIDRVQVDAHTGGTWSIGAGGIPVLTGGTWHTGTATAGPALSLPSGVTAGQVNGLRYTFTKADGSNWENPANPKQNISFTVTRRDTLHTGGPVPSDLAGSTPAPGETVAGDNTNTTDADVTSSDKDANGNPLTAHDDADAIIHYHHANNAVQVRKTPNGSIESPGTPFKYTMTFTNTGDVDITNPVITDVFPSDADGPQIQLAPDPAYSFALDPTGTQMPTDPADVTIDATDTGITFTFPNGSTLPIGATYTITFQVVTRPGLAAGTEFTNTVGITGDRPWDACDGGTGGGLDPGTGQCKTIATNTVSTAGAIAVSKQVKAEGSDVLGVATDPLYAGGSRKADCTANAAGFYVRPCIPIAQPGGDITWRWHFINSGNLPLDRILGIDRLPAPGDTVATAPDLERLSDWRPLLSGARPQLADGPAGTLHVYYTTGSRWCDGPKAADGYLLCDARNPASGGAGLTWTEWPAGETLPVSPSRVTGLQIDFVPDTTLAPAGTFDVDVAMKAPAYSPADTPNTTKMSPEDAYAFNSVGTSARVVGGAAAAEAGDVHVDAAGDPYTLTTEPPRVGVGLADGGVRVEKVVDGPAAGEFAPATVRVTLHCTSVGVNVPIPANASDLTLTPGEPVTVYDLPYHATCVMTEQASGQQNATVTTAVVQRNVTDFQTVTATNTYDYASLAITKQVESAAVDQDGKPIPYGPFVVTVTCTYKGQPDYAAGYGPDKPMVADLSDGKTVTFIHLHPGASCEINESDDKGARSTTVVTTVDDNDPTTTDGADTTIELSPDSDDGNPTNTALITNTFDVGSLNVIKKVTGAGAKENGAGPFTVAVKCVLDDASGTRTVWDGTVKLGGGAPLHATITDIAAGATCTVTEPDNGGASAVSIDPSGPIPVDANAIATVTVTNTFNASGAGGSGAGGSGNNLASTGVPIGSDLLWGIALLVSGAALIVLGGVGRRRGRHRG